MMVRNVREFDYLQFYDKSRVVSPETEKITISLNEVPPMVKLKGSI